MRLIACRVPYHMHTPASMRPPPSLAVAAPPAARPLAHVHARLVTTIRNLSSPINGALPPCARARECSWEYRWAAMSGRADRQHEQARPSMRIALREAKNHLPRNPQTNHPYRCWGFFAPYAAFKRLGARIHVHVNITCTRKHAAFKRLGADVYVYMRGSFTSSQSQVAEAPTSAPASPVQPCPLLALPCSSTTTTVLGPWLASPCPWPQLPPRRSMRGTR